VNETNVMAPLQAFHGLKPPAPIWFENAIAEEPERTFVTVEGARVETLAWGKRGNPGLVFLHGGAAHADWWSFVAPFFARERRVVAPTFTGMGRSDWRQVYSFDQFVREAREAGRAAGAYEAGPPTVVGHSFGGRVAMGLAGDFGEELQGAVMVDPPFFAKDNLRPRSPPRPTKERRILVFACPRSPRRITSCPARIAFSSCGSTVSSKPRIPAESGSPSAILRSRFVRSSSATGREVQPLSRRAPSVLARPSRDVRMYGRRSTRRGSTEPVSAIHVGQLDSSTRCCANT